MSNVVKIFEVKSLGYTQLEKELKSIDTLLKNVRAAKKAVNELKIDPADSEQLKNQQRESMTLTVRINELKNAKKTLVQEMIAGVNADQLALDQQKKLTSGVVAEIGSLTELIERRKQLKTLVSGQAEGNFNPIQLGNQSFTRPEAISEIKVMNSEIDRLKGQFQSTKTFGEQMNESISNGFKNMRGQLTQLTLTYLGWFAAFQQAGKFIEENIKLSDTFADLQIRIHGTKDEVTSLFDQLKKIDTRTSLASLVDISNVVAKKGVPKEEIAGLTAEFDKLNVVLGHEIGEPTSAVANIIKLISIFNDDKHVTKERVAEIGTELFKLTTTGVATGEFLINFAERVGAVRGITGLALPNILGMGAALQQLGQRTEVAGTAAVQLTTKVFSDVPKFAKAAGKSIEEFRATLDKNPFEALIQVAEGLKNVKGDELAANFEEVVQAFGEVGVSGVRIKAVLGDIATNGAFVRDRMKQAAVNSADYANQTAALDLKQHSLAATIERVKKVFEGLATSKTVQITFAAIASAVLFLTSSLTFLMPIIAAYGVIWAIANGSMIQARIGAFLLNAQLTIQYAALVVASTFQRAYAVSLAYMTGATAGATAATTLLNIALRLLPIGAVIALIAFLAAGCTAAANKVTLLSESLRKKAAVQQAVIDITAKANEITSQQISQMDILAAVINDAATSLDTKRDALEKLIPFNEKFSKVVINNVNDLQQFRTVLKDVKNDMQIFAQAQAAQALSKDKYDDYLKAIKDRQDLERLGADPRNQIQVKSGTAVKVPNESEGKYFGLGSLTTKVYAPAEFKKTIDDMKAKETEKFQIYNDFLEVAKGYELKASEKTKVINDQSAENFKAANVNDPKSPAQLQELIKDIDKQLSVLKEGDPKIKALIAQREAFQKRLDTLNGKVPTLKEYKGARLTGQDKDEISLIESKYKMLQSKEEERFLAIQLDHRATADEELEHIEKMRDIDARSIKAKILSLENNKNLNAKEKEQLASFHKEKLDIELKAANDSQRVRDEEFNRRSKNLKVGLDKSVSDINVDTNVRTTDQSISEVDRAQIKLTNDKKILDLQVKYNNDLDELEKSLNQKSKENALQGAKTREQIIADSVTIMNAKFKDAATAANEIASELQINASNQIIKALDSGGSTINIAKQIQKINDDLNRNLEINQVAHLKIELSLYEKGVRDKLKSEAEYQAALAELKKAEAKLREDTINKELTAFQKFTKLLKDFVASSKEGIFGVKSYTNDDEGNKQKEQDALKEAQQDTENAAKLAYDNYWKRENSKIDFERDAQKERIDRETEVVKARAQSQAELDSIDAQQAAKKKELDRKASEEKKKLALKQIAIDFAISIVKAIAQYGLPLALIPIAAQTALYFVQKAQIQSQQFEYGGEVPLKGGKFGGKPHSQGGTPFGFKGNRYEAEVDELAIVRTKNASPNTRYSISGTQMEIASKLNKIGGGVDFRGGGQITKQFESGGVLGSSYPAPVFQNSSDNILEYVTEVRNLTIEVSNRIDRLEVQQTTSSVSDALKKQVKQSQIGVLR